MSTAMTLPEIGSERRRTGKRMSGDALGQVMRRWVTGVSVVTFSTD